MKFVFKKHAGIAALLGFSTAAQAAEWQVYPASQSHHFVNPRPAGMGEAFTAVADDQNALYYNPAGLAKLGSWGYDYIEILSPQFTFTNYDYHAFDNFKDMASLELSTLTSNPETFSKFRTVLAKVRNNPYYARFGINPFFIKKNFGFGIYLNNELSLSLHDGNTLARIEDVLDADTRFGYARSFMGEKLAVGATAGYRVRGNVDFNVRIDEISKYTGSGNEEVLKKELKTGYAIPVDFGVMFTPIETWSPTMALAIQNVGDSKFYLPSFTQEFSKSKPTPLKQSINLGMSVTPRFGKKLFARAAMDFRDVNLPRPASEKFRVGLEGGLERLFTLQAGMANNALSFGMETKLYVLNLRYATYVVERGYASGQKPERRHLINARLFL
jgi:hypothetical protein